MHKIGLYISVFFRMARSLQLLSIALVYLFGIIIAAASGWAYDFEAIIIEFLALMPISVSIHYANEYADYETDSLTTRTPYSGGSGALPESGLAPRIALIGAWAVLLIGSLTALAGAISGILASTTLIILAVGAFFGWKYSLPPLKLAWRGYGEFTNAALGGVLLTIYGYSTQTGKVDGFILLATIPFGMLAFNNLLAVTWSDRGADASAGKNTLAVQLNQKHLRLIYAFVALTAYLLLVFLHEGIFPPIVAAAGFAALPLTLWAGGVYTRKQSPFPSVAAMMVFLIVQTIAWWTLI